MLTSFSPLYSRVEIEILENSATPNGILVPESQERTIAVEAKVLAVGPGYTNKDGSTRPLTVKPNDIVIVKKFCIDDIKFAGKTHHTVDEQHILAVKQI